MELMDLIWSVKKFGLENFFRRYYSVYPAIVVNNKDPENRGRLKLKVPDLVDDKELAEWAEPTLPTAGYDKTALSSITGGKFGSFFPPKIGDFVWVEFRMGDVNSPVYRHGGWWGKNEMPDFITDDRKNAIFISRYGHQITVDETTDAAKINIQSNKNYQILIDETSNSENITVTCGLSGNQIKMYDQPGQEYIRITDKNGDVWKWDLNSKTWTINFNGHQEITISEYVKSVVEQYVDQTINDYLKVTVANTTTVNSGGNASHKQPTIAIGNGSIELLKTIFDMMTQLGTVRILTPVGPAAPMNISPEWTSAVVPEMQKVQTITGSFN